MVFRWLAFGSYRASDAVAISYETYHKKDHMKFKRNPKHLLDVTITPVYKPKLQHKLSTCLQNHDFL